MDDPVHAAAIMACRTALEKRGEKILLLDLCELSAMADYFIIVTGRSKTHAKALAHALEEAVESFPLKCRGIEGSSDGSWILMDYYDLVIHIFLPEDRDYYNLEKLWAAARVKAFQEGMLSSSGIQ